MSHCVYVRASGDTGISFHWEVPEDARVVSAHDSYGLASQALVDYRKKRDNEAAADRAQTRLPL